MDNKHRKRNMDAFMDAWIRTIIDIGLQPEGQRQRQNQTPVDTEKWGKGEETRTTGFDLHKIVIRPGIYRVYSLQSGL